MSAPVLKYCLVALLSQDADTQTSEKNALIAEEFVSTQLAACMREYGENPEKAEEILLEMSAVARTAPSLPSPKKSNMATKTAPSLPSPKKSNMATKTAPSLPLPKKSNMATKTAPSLPSPK